MQLGFTNAGQCPERSAVAVSLLDVLFGTFVYWPESTKLVVARAMDRVAELAEGGSLAMWC
jgi:hypothetical protein